MIALLRMGAGLVVWAIAFCVLYGMHGIGCAAGWSARELGGGISLHRGLLIAAWLAFVAAGAAVALWRRASRATMIDRVAWRLALIGVVATATTGLPILILPDCL